MLATWFCILFFIHSLPWKQDTTLGISWLSLFVWLFFNHLYSTVSLLHTLLVSLLFLLYSWKSELLLLLFCIAAWVSMFEKENPWYIQENLGLNDETWDLLNQLLSILWCIKGHLKYSAIYVGGQTLHVSANGTWFWETWQVELQSLIRQHDY